MTATIDWIRLGASSSIALAATGPAAYAHPARIRLSAGEHAFEQECEFLNVEAFCDSLSAMHQTLRGTASLDSLEDDFHLTLSSGEFGHIGVDASLLNHCGGWAFKIWFDIDQSYLPSLISDLRSEFLKRAHT